MEKNIKKTEVPEDNDLLRLKALAEKSGKTVEELLTGLEEDRLALEENLAKANQSTGSQNSTEASGFDPLGSEFLKGIWGK